MVLGFLGFEGVLSTFSEFGDIIFFFTEMAITYEEK